MKMEIPDTEESEIIFHAGTKSENGGIVTSGGRVLAATAMGDDIRDALARSNSLAEKVSFDGKYFRRDIGFDL